MPKSVAETPALAPELVDAVVTRAQQRIVDRKKSWNRLCREITIDRGLIEAKIDTHEAGIRIRKRLASKEGYIKDVAEAVATLKKFGYNVDDPLAGRSVNDQTEII